MENNNIYVGDCKELLKQIPDNSVDLFLTSPPYANIKNKYNNISSNAPNTNNYCEWLIPHLNEMARCLKPTGSLILNINDCVINGGRSIYVFELIASFSRQSNLTFYERLIWNKGKSLSHPKRFRDNIEYIFWFVKDINNFTLNFNEMRVPYDSKSINRAKNPIKKRHIRTEENQEQKEYKKWILHPKGAVPSVLVNIGSESKRVSNIHVAVYPERLCEYFIKGTTNEGDLVVDPFSGSGTTLVSAKKLKRNYIGFDINESYVEESKKRLGI